jgi:hypothetical protein
MRGQLAIALAIVIGMSVLEAQTSFMTVSVRVVRSCPVDVQASTLQPVVRCSGNAAPRAQITESTEMLPSAAPAPQTSDNADTPDGAATLAPFVDGSVDAGSESAAPQPKARFRVLTINY